MPNYYAHHVFGREVLAALPPLLRGTLERERAAFEVGLYGPDPFFFANPVTAPGARQMALKMHKQSFLAVSEGLVEAVRADLPLARGYAAGFLCHFALDSRCHYYIEEQRERRGLSHTGMEMELDRALMLADGVDPLRETPLGRLELPEGFLETVKAVYPQAEPQQFVQSYGRFRRLCRMQTRLAGTRACRAADWVGVRYPRLAVVKGSLLPARPNPLYDRPTAVLTQLLYGEVPPTAQAMGRFFAVVARGGQLDSWFDRPFSGQWTAEREMGAEVNSR